MNKIYTFSLTLLFSGFIHGQNEFDALRYSQITFGGTARYNAMAGSFGALGGDFSTLSSNPAGIAFFRRNEITLTPTLMKQTIQSSGNGSANSANSTAFNFQNAGIVWAFNPFGRTTKWRYMDIGFGYNRMGDFNGNTNISVNNANASLVDEFLHNANGSNSGNLDPFKEGLAYNTFLIDNPGKGQKYVAYFDKENNTQYKSIQTSGGMGETVLSVGGNYSGKLYIGATMGFQHVSYSENSSYTERSGNDSAGKVRSFQFDQDLITSGTGINFKFGAIYRATDWMRIGVALHSPTSFSLNDKYSNSMITNFKDSTNRDQSPNGNYNYKLVTPARFIGSLGFIISKKGLLNLDYEFVDYSYARLNSGDAGVFDQPNSSIQQNYRATNNIRLGGEWRLLNFLALRAGFAYYGSPYSAGVNFDARRISYTGGIGFREKNFYADFSYVLMQYKDNYFLTDATITDQKAITNSYNLGKTMITLGFKF